MYFKKLEISGFKSFADRTVLHFEPGITAIVGPNGCGKSNIFDSMRWCLGEQSIKSLRGSKSEDVIFNGTEAVPAQNMAEVSLTISNEAKILPIDYDEVTITRRLFRTGDSEYLINNNTVRLRDINELLMGTGIGAESYSLVEQGKIDLVISSRPEDRRLVFDEATGVSKYKAKKREAMKKLEETDQNLLRVNDIIAEVRRQIGSIERQASKARRYKEIFEQLKAAELKFASIEIRTIKAELSMISELSKKSQEDEAEQNAELEALDAKVIHQQKELQELDAKLTEMKDAIAALESLTLRHEQHIKLDQDRVVDLDQHIRVLGRQNEQLKAKIETHEKNIKDLSEQLDSHHQVFAEKERTVLEKEASLNAVTQEIGNALTQNKELKERLFELNLSETKAHNESNEVATSIHTLLARQRRLETEKLKTEEENTEVLKGLEAVQAQISEEKGKIDGLTHALIAAQNKRTELEVSLRELDQEVRRLENEKLTLASQMAFLKELRLKYDSMAEAKTGTMEVTDLPAEKVTGIIAHARDVAFDEASKTYRIKVELKYINFDLEGLEARSETIARTIEEKVRALHDKEHELMQIVAEVQKVDDELQQERFNLSNKEAASTNLSDNARRIHDELSVITIELDEVTLGLAKSRERSLALEGDLKSWRDEITASETTVNDNTVRVTELGRVKEAMLIEFTALRTELANQKAQQESLAANLDFFKTSLAQDSETAGLHESEMAASQTKIRELEEEIASLETQIASQQDEVDGRTREHHALSQMRIEEVNTLDFLQKQIIDLEERIDKTKEELHHTQMQEQELGFRLTNTKTRIQQVYNIDLESSPLPEEELEAIVPDALNAEIAALRERVEGFGTVNLVAIEELEELKNRYEFLTQQHNDLVMAKDTLSKTIQKINRNTRKMFLETFQIVAEEFKNYFRLLFGGGEAKLFLIDEEDVLESGIEIVCRPPGKKLQNITLLSGGEKSLSAIALIFAIFKTKPSPFCVLDEIDAALDESNIDRFSRMLSDFATVSQFIVITHNKKTISRAHVMYGITMERSGISKIVSVKLEESNIKRPAALSGVRVKPPIDILADEPETPESVTANEPDPATEAAAETPALPEPSSEGDTSSLA